ncbi:MAG TPA: LysM peptidoglycan-binding domain-containing protein [Oscillospiraceae bacterium]|nr:LysM peptidoglycan-binding domain-containing protein [Oscillospiraceae bacterium]
MRKSFLGILTAVLVLLMAGQALASHVVQPGETLWKISQHYNTTVAALAKENSLSNVNHLEVGQVLAIPGAGAQVVHTVQPGETLWKISQHYKTTVAAIAAANKIANVNTINIGAKLVIPGAKAGQTNLPDRSGRTFSASELDLLARLVQAEAGGESYQGQVAVAATILNRLGSPRFPNTISGVIYQVVNGYYQYSPVLDGRISQPAADSARRAATEAINGADPTSGATGFYNPRKTTNQWVRQQPVTVTIGNHVFFK